MNCFVSKIAAFSKSSMQIIKIHLKNAGGKREKYVDRQSNFVTNKKKYHE